MKKRALHAPLDYILFFNGKKGEYYTYSKLVNWFLCMVSTGPSHYQRDEYLYPKTPAGVSKL